MSVIAHLRLPAEAFELGRIMHLEGETNVELNAVVPLGDQAIPLVSVYQDRESFQDRVADHPSVTRFSVVSSHDDETIYALDWQVDRDVFFQGLQEVDAHILSVSGTSDKWEFELRLPDHDALSSLQQYSRHAHIPLEVGRIYNPTRPEQDPWFGLTAPQRETLVRAVRCGYYDIPRQTSTQELAAEFDVSDQAGTERLRRAIVTLVGNTLESSTEPGREEDGK